MIVTDQIVVPDLSATAVIDLPELKHRYSISQVEAAIEEDPEDADARQLLEELSEHLERCIENRDGHPTIVIGYIPTRKLSSLRNASVLNQKSREMRIADREKHIADLEKAVADKRTPEMERLLAVPAVDTREYFDAVDDIMREYVRWGVKGHGNLDVDFESVDERVGPFTFQVATWEMVDIYERIDMLMPLWIEIRDFNELQEKKSARSSSRLGTSRITSTVQYAKQRQASSGCEDATEKQKEL